MKKDLHLRINEITRVEGHGNIVIDVKNGEVRELKLEIIESPRFFEAMLRGRKYDEAQHIMSRICGICAVSHTSASLKAIEDALGMEISPQAALLRKLAFSGENIQSHILHLYFLVLPDLLGTGSIVPLLKTHPEVARRGLGLKRLSNEICAVVAGRHIHPISLFPGGVVHTPKKVELEHLKSELSASFTDLDATLDMLMELPVPAFTRAREFISLKAPEGYGIYDGEPFSSVSEGIGTSEYTERVREYLVDHSAAKHAESPSGPFMVGALARFNNNFSALSPRAKAAAEKAGMKVPVDNPFMNNMAQLIECFHLTEVSIGLIDELLAMGPVPEEPSRPIRAGRGIGIVEAPRGLLYHDYTINDEGIVEKANCLIPTAQNLRCIEDDLRAFVPSVLDEPKERIARGVESLVRAYDPCISCSTHIMKVRFV